MSKILDLDQFDMNLKSPKFFRCYQNIKTVKKQQKDMYTVKEQMRNDGEYFNRGPAGHNYGDMRGNLIPTDGSKLKRF